MKMTARALAPLLATAIAAPALAQVSGGSRGAGNEAPPPESEGQPAPAQASSSGQIKPSKGAYKAIIDLQNAVNQNTPDVAAKLAAAQAVATTKEDKYLVAQFQLKIAAKQNNTAAAAAAVEAMAATGMIDNVKLGSLYRGLGGSYYNAKQYAQATAAWKRAVALNPNDTESQRLIGQASLASGNKSDALASIQNTLAARKAAGQKAEEDLYKSAVQLAYDTKSPTAVQLSREWVAAYPSPESWHNAIAIYRNLNRPDVEGTLSLLRLMRAAGAMTGPGDYALYASAAADQLNFNEAQVVIDEGIAAKKVDPSSAQFKQIIPPLKNKAKATAADLAVASRTAANGMALLRIGDRYYAMKDYGKAVESYRKAMGKPGVDPDVANLHIGFALAAAGDKAGATQALNAVKGSRAEIAQYWLLYLQGRA